MDQQRINLHDKRIYDIYINIHHKKKLNYYDLSKIFEYYSCIMLSKKYDEPFYMYKEIEPSLKEKHGLTRRDTGIDLCNLKDKIVQCKL